MELLQAILQRRSCRVFRDDPVDSAVVEELLRRAGMAPSALNLQPWEVTVVMGRELERLRTRLIRARGERAVSCSPGSSRPLPEVFQQRRRASFAPLAELLSQQGMDVNAFVEEGSCRFYGAPVALILSMDRAFSLQRLLCLGIFLGYLLLAAEDLGLATCPVGLVAAYADEIREFLNIPSEKEVVLGVAVGFRDETSPLDRFRTPREPLDRFVRWYA